MKKIICLLLALLLILSMAVPAAAVTPTLNTPTITVPDISDSVKANIEEQYDFDAAVDAYLEEHPIEITPTEEPTEPTEEDEPSCPDYHDWLSGWLRWWRELIH